MTKSSKPYILTSSIVSMIDVKGAPPDYVASTPIELRPQQSNNAAHKAYFTPAPPSENLGTSSGGGQPVVVEDDAAIGTRYQAERTCLLFLPWNIKVSSLLSLTQCLLDVPEGTTSLSESLDHVESLPL